MCYLYICVHACVYWGSLIGTAILEIHLVNLVPEISLTYAHGNKRMHTATLFVLVKMQKPYKCLSLVEWVANDDICLQWTIVQRSKFINLGQLGQLKQACTLIKQCYLF